MQKATLQAGHARFVAEYLVDGNGARAAVAAGYSPTGAAVTAHRLLRREDVRAAIEAQQASDATRLGIERQDVISGLLEAFRMAREQGDPAVMVSASRELGRLLGLYPPETRSRAAHAAAPARDVRLMPDDQLQALIAAQS